jgi:putative DNA primase/helicase
MKNHQLRQPLTALELARRAAVLSANQPKSLNGSEAELTGATSNACAGFAAARPQRLDFGAVSSAALSALDFLVPKLLPNGYRSAGEWVARNPTRNDGRPGSFKVNMKTGVWSDFATGDKGGDAIDLVAYLQGKSKLDAARELQQLLNVKPAAGSSTLTGNIRSTGPRNEKVAAAPSDARDAPASFPARTPPDQDGKPHFIVVGDEGPRLRDDERRRHTYRQSGVPVRIKILRRGGDAFNVFRVLDASTGKVGWQYRKPDGFEAVPFFVGIDPFSEASPSFPLLWPEGEKDVETLSKAKFRAFTFGGTGDGLPFRCEEYVKARHLVILADNDDAGRKHAAGKAALAHGVAASIRVLHFPDTPKGGDVSDWFAAGKTSADLSALIEATQPWEPKNETSPGPSEGAAETVVEAAHAHRNEEHIAGRAEPKKQLPPGYSFSDRGLMWQNPDDLDKPAVLIAGHFDVAAETRDGDGASWGVLLHWKDHDSRDHQFALPRSTLAGDGSEARRILMDGGFFIAPSQSARGLFNSFLLQVKSPNRARATQRVGWHGNSFVMPDDCFGVDRRDTLLLQSATAHEHSFRQSGTLESWQQEVARYATGNSRLALAISAAFAGPLVGPCAAEGGGLHFKGASSTGKSTALHVAGSVWGGGDTNGYVRSWRATANGLEGVALNHSDTLLCLDELSQLASKDAGEAAYMLANGAGKSRSTRDGSARQAAKWRVLFLSSGEIGLADKVAEDGRGRRIAAGQQVRIVDVAADAGAGMGMFEKLHGFTSAEMLARHLRAATQQHYGVAARHYLPAIVPEIDGLRQQIAPIMKAFSEQYVPTGADGQIERVAQRFALIAVGGELAQQRGIVPWAPGEAIAAAGRCFSDWLAARGGHDAAEVRDGLEQVRSFLLANGMARFIPAWETDQDTRIHPRDVAGYRQKVGDGWDFFVTTTAWKEEVCRGLDARRLAATLALKGYMDAPDPARRAKHVRVPGHGQLRLYHIVSRLLEDGE